MPKIIPFSIDLRLIDQSRCKKMVRQNGEQASFCNLVLIETPGGKYGDWMVKQEVSKEEREADIKMPIIGNGKNVGQKPKPIQGEHSSRPAPPQKRAPDPDLDGVDSLDIPF